jgi:hypothetical protein
MNYARKVNDAAETSAGRLAHLFDQRIGIFLLIGGTIGRSTILAKLKHKTSRRNMKGPGLETTSPQLLGYALFIGTKYQ